MPNTGSLEGMACPKCGPDFEFNIFATAEFVVRDDGTEDYHDVQWDEDSYAGCRECGWHGVVRDLYTTKTGGNNGVHETDGKNAE